MTAMQSESQPPVAETSEPLTCRGAWNEDFVDQCRELGMAMAAGLEAGVF